jgi:hypothetical protein
MNAGELRYLSQRLARDVVQRWEADGASVSARSSDFRPVEAEQVELPVGENPYQLAEQAKRIVLTQSQSGELANEDEEVKPYLFIPRARVRLWVFRPKASSRGAIAFASVRRDPHMAVLLGSPKNVTGWNGLQEIDGWIPSDPVGLRDVVQKLKEDVEQDVLGVLPWRQAIDDAASFAVNITRTPDFDGVAEVLARIYASDNDLKAIVTTTGPPATSYTFNRVLVGAPIFIRESTGPSA